MVQPANGPPVVLSDCLKLKIVAPVINLQVLPGSPAGSPGIRGGLSSSSGLHPAQLHLSVLL